LKIDLDYLRRHYASLSDDGLLEIDETELVDDARRIYDEEVAARGLERQGEDGVADSGIVTAPGDADEESPDEESIEDADEEPDWLGDATCAATFSARPGMDSADSAREARGALEAAGIPCHLASSRVEPPRNPESRKELRLMVPSRLNLEAESVLDKQIFNQELEAQWKTHFQLLSDEELRSTDLEALLAGMRDRIERVTRAYQDELAQRD